MSSLIQIVLVLSYALVAGAAGYAANDVWPGLDGVLVGFAVFGMGLVGHAVVLRAADRADLMAEIDLLRRNHSETLRELAEIKLSLAGGHPVATPAVATPALAAPEPRPSLPGGPSAPASPQA